MVMVTIGSNLQKKNVLEIEEMYIKQIITKNRLKTHLQNIALL